MQHEVDEMRTVCLPRPGSFVRRNKNFGEGLKGRKVFGTKKLRLIVRQFRCVFRSWRAGCVLMLLSSFGPFSKKGHSCRKTRNANHRFEERTTRQGLKIHGVLLCSEF